MKITFQSIEIDDQDVSLLLDSLHPDLPLVHLSLQDNMIGPTGLQALLRTMTKHSTWKELNLNGNRTIGFDGLQLVGEELYDLHVLHGQPDINVTIPKLIAVHVNECVVWNEYTKEDTEAALQQNMARNRAEQALLDGVNDNVYIGKLSTHRNHFAKEAMLNIEFYLLLNRMGRYLLGTNHGLACTIWCQILAKRDPYVWDQVLFSSAIFYFLREQPHLVVPRKND